MSATTKTKRVRCLKLNELDEATGGMTLTTALRILPNANAHGNIGQQHQFGITQQANVAPAQNQAGGIDTHTLEQLIANQNALARQIGNQNTANANALAQARAQQQSSAAYTSQLLQSMRMSSLLNQFRQGRFSDPNGFRDTFGSRSGGSARRSGGGGGHDDFSGGSHRSSGGGSHGSSGGGSHGSSGGQVSQAHYGHGPGDGGGHGNWGRYRDNAPRRATGHGNPPAAHPGGQTIVPKDQLREQTQIGSGKGDQPAVAHSTPSTTGNGAPPLSPLTVAEAALVPSKFLGDKSPVDIMHGRGSPDGMQSTSALPGLGPNGQPIAAPGNGLFPVSPIQTTTPPGMQPTSALPGLGPNGELIAAPGNGLYPTVQTTQPLSGDYPGQTPADIDRILNGSLAPTDPNHVLNYNGVDTFYGNTAENHDPSLDGGVLPTVAGLPQIDRPEPFGNTAENHDPSLDGGVVYGNTAENHDPSLDGGVLAAAAEPYGNTAGNHDPSLDGGVLPTVDGPPAIDRPAASYGNTSEDHDPSLDGGAVYGNTAENHDPSLDGGVVYGNTAENHDPSLDGGVLPTVDGPPAIDRPAASYGNTSEDHDPSLDGGPVEGNTAEDHDPSLDE